MEQDLAPAPKKRLTAFGRKARQKRIFARLREGWAYDEIAREERLTAARVRMIVSEVLQKREVDDSSAHALLQLSRLAPAVQLAASLAPGGVLATQMPSTARESSHALMRMVAAEGPWSSRLLPVAKTGRLSVSSKTITAGCVQSRRGPRSG